MHAQLNALRIDVPRLLMCCMKSTLNTTGDERSRSIDRALGLACHLELEAHR